MDGQGWRCGRSIHGKGQREGFGADRDAGDDGYALSHSATVFARRAPHDASQGTELEEDSGWVHVDDQLRDDVLFGGGGPASGHDGQGSGRGGHSGQDLAEHLRYGRRWRTVAEVTHHDDEPGTQGKRRTGEAVAGKLARAGVAVAASDPGEYPGAAHRYVKAGRGTGYGDPYASVGRHL